MTTGNGANKAEDNKALITASVTSQATGEYNQSGIPNNSISSEFGIHRPKTADILP